MKHTAATLYVGGTILPLTGRLARAAGLLVEDGKIRAVGDPGTLAALCPRARRVELHGAAVLPGFVDGHSHFSMALQLGPTADLGSCGSFEAIGDALAAFGRSQGSDVILGWGYDHIFLPGGAHPTRQLLDQVSDRLPVLAVHSSGHVGVANSAALTLAGITETSPVPRGGSVGRDPETGALTGYLEETALFQCLNALRARQQIDPARALEAAQQRYLSHGITTAQDGYSGRATWETLLGLKDRLRVDVVVYPGLDEDARQLVRAYAGCTRAYTGRVKLGGYKIQLDGSPQSRTAWLSRPYVGGDTCGLPRMDDAAAQALVDAAAEDRLQLLAHCNGDAASEQLLRCWERRFAADPGLLEADLRPVMIHCQTVRRDQLDRMAALGMVPSVFVGHVYYWGDVHLRNLGPDRGEHISPCRWMLEAGLPLNLHQDFPVTRPDMLHSIWCAVNRLSRTGQALGPDQRIDPYDAFRAACWGGAYGYHEENFKGTLEPGKRADLVILDRDPFTVPPISLRNLRILATIKDGVEVYRAQSWNR